MVKKGIESNMVGKKKKETGQIDTHTHTYIYIYYVQQKAMLHGHEQGHGHDMDTNTGIQQFLKIRTRHSMDTAIK